jgi:hypothetical protein
MIDEKDAKEAARGVSRREFIKNAGIATAVWATGYDFLIPGPSLAAQAGDTAEWTYEQAAKVWKPMTRAVQHVGVPGCQWQTGVMWDGALLFGPLDFRYLSVMQDELKLLGSRGASQGDKEVVGNRLHLSVAYGSTMHFADRVGTGKPAIRRRLENGRLPLPYVETTDGDLVWEESVFAHLLGRDFQEGMDPQPDDLPITHAIFKVRNRGSQPQVGHLWLHFADTTQVTLGYKCAQGDELGNALDHTFATPLGMMKDLVRYVIPPPSQGQVTWHEEGPTPEGMKRPAKRVIEWEVPLKSGEEAQLRVLIPYGPVEREMGLEILKLNSASLYEQAKEFWRDIVEGETGLITTPDGFVNDYLAAVVGQMAEQTAYRHASKIWMYKTSPNWYEGYWPCNAAKALPTLDLRGLTKYSRLVLKSYIDTQSSDIGNLTKDRREGKHGSVPGEGFADIFGFMGNFGEWTANTLLVSHGLELWALASHYRITRDREWLGEGPGSPLHAIISACDWIGVQRKRTMFEQSGKKVPQWGLLPASSAHDWFAGHTASNDLFCIFGMIESVRLLREINHPHAEEVAHELKDYRSCFRDRYREARDRARRVPLPDGSDFPYVPREVSEVDWTAVDWTYTWGSLIRAGAYGALEPHDELVDQALGFVEGGMPKGQGYYFNLQSYQDKFGRFIAAHNFADVSDPAAARHYLWKHYVEYETMWPVGFDLFLQRDDLPRFFEWLFNNLFMSIHHDFRVGVESLDGVPSNSPGEGERWRAIRDMFVNERGGYDGTEQSLWLLQALPRCWLKPGDHLVVKRMGTHFGGLVDLEVKMAGDGNSVGVSSHFDLVVAPTEIRMRLRSGDGRPLASAKVNGVDTKVLEKDTIVLPNGTTGNYHIFGRFI